MVSYAAAKKMPNSSVFVSEVQSHWLDWLRQPEVKTRITPPTVALMVFYFLLSTSSHLRHGGFSATKTL